MSIPLHLVTGFFGSGKTSFLKHYLSVLGKSQKIAVIQNEFSSVNMDGKELSLTDNYQILEVNNGSVFCVCLLGSFINSLAAFIDEIQPEVLIMEASGMSDPIGVAQIFQAEKIKKKVYLGHVWSVIDAHNFFKTTALRNRVNHQIRIADTVILNKVDLLESSGSQIIDEIKKVNPFAQLLESTFGKIDLSDLKKRPNFFPGSSQNSDGRPDLNSIVIKSNREIGEKPLSEFLKLFGDNLIRCKGFVKVKSSKTIFVQGVFDDLKFEEVPTISEPTELVLIGTFTGSDNYQTRFDEFCKL